MQQGSINTTALVVPDLYVAIVPPQNLILNGVPSGRIGVIGSAQWGPLNTPVIVGNMADYAKNFGGIQNRSFDAGTAVALAVLQGAQDFRVVRVGDGSQAAATNNAVGGVACLSLTALYTGSLGNSLTATLAAGSKPNSWKLNLALPGQVPETFDSIGAVQTTTTAAVSAATAVPVASVAGLSTGMIASGPGLTGSPTIASISGNTVTLSATQTIAAGALLTFNPTANAFWLAARDAINNGQGALRGASQLVTATAGAGVILAAAGSYLLAGGVDGATSITWTLLVGNDASRTGMYALRTSGVSILVLADGTDSTLSLASTVDAFAQAEGMYAIQTLPAATSVATAVTTKAAAGLDSWTTKLLHGDWIYWQDTANGVLRKVSPQGMVAGRLSNLSPEQSGLNKPIYGVVGSEKTGLSVAIAQNMNYSSAELTALGQAGIDVIANPVPGGTYYGLRFGHNSSSNAATLGDNYTRLTNYIAATLNAGMGKYVGQLINAELFRRVRSTLLAFLQGMRQQGQLGSTDGSVPFSVICDLSNNPDIRTSIGYLQADVQIKYQAIVEKFLVNVEGGQTVQVTRQTLPGGQT